MSGFDDNPFGEPQIDDNPFKDPSVQQHTRTAPLGSQSLEDYNPFENETKPSQTQSAVVQPQVQTPPSYNPSGQQYDNGGSGGVTQISTAELQRRQEELERKAAELERREAELRNSTESATRRNNWPPLPDKFCFQPCFYHDIQVDIPSAFQTIVTNLYKLWIFYALLMCVNVLGGLTVLFNSGIFATFGLALFYCLIFTPTSFLCWYRPAYRAFQNDSSFNFMVFFFVFFFQTLVTIVQAIGIPGGGSCGFIIALQQFNGSVGGIFAGIFLLFLATGFAVCAAGNAMMLTKIHSIYRTSGASMQKARSEFMSEMSRNATVQQAASSALSSAVSSQFNNNTNTNRY